MRPEPQRCTNVAVEPTTENKRSAQLCRAGSDAEYRKPVLNHGLKIGKSQTQQGKLPSRLPPLLKGLIRNERKTKAKRERGNCSSNSCIVDPV